MLGSQLWIIVMTCSELDCQRRHGVARCTGLGIYTANGCLLGISMAAGSQFRVVLLTATVEEVMPGVHSVKEAVEPSMNACPYQMPATVYSQA